MHNIVAYNLALWRIQDFPLGRCQSSSEGGCRCPTRALFGENICKTRELSPVAGVGWKMGAGVGPATGSATVLLQNVAIQFFDFIVPYTESQNPKLLSPSPPGHDSSKTRMYSSPPEGTEVKPFVICPIPIHPYEHGTSNFYIEI